MTPPPQDFLVIKLGGSLLDLPDLADRVRAVVELSCASNCTPLIVAGGGPAADVIRGWDQVHKLDEPAAHWMAVRSLQLSAQLLTLLIPESAIVSSAPEAHQRWQVNEIPVLDCLKFLESNSTLESDRETNDTVGESGRYQLPRSWEVTSDSIALFTAVNIAADRLLLLKSVNCPMALPPQDAAQHQHIDGHFPELLNVIANPISISWCNLRTDDLRIEEWL